MSQRTVLWATFYLRDLRKRAHPQIYYCFRPSWRSARNKHELNWRRLSANPSSQSATLKTVQYTGKAIDQRDIAAAGSSFCSMQVLNKLNARRLGSAASITATKALKEALRLAEQDSQKVRQAPDRSSCETLVAAHRDTLLRSN